MIKQQITQGEVSRFTDIDNSHLGKFLKGTRNININILGDILSFLGLQLKL